MKLWTWVLLVALPALALAAEQPAQPAATDVKASAQAFVQQLADGQFDAATERFDEAMRKALPPDELKGVWASITASAGAFQQQTGVRQEDQAAYRVVFVTCRFEKTPLDTKVVYDEAGRIAGLWFMAAQQMEYSPPAYVDRASFADKDLTVGAGGEWALPGTLSLPNGAGPFPAVVLVHGSGPQDRDETVGGSKPFRDLAWGLASRGVAVLRYEKRTKAYGPKLAGADNRITVKEEVVDDAAAAVSLLRKTEGIDGRRVFVLGHSLGGMLVPRIAAAAPDAAGFIIMAGTTRALEDVVLDQLAYITSSAGELPPEAKARLDAMRQQAEEAKALKPEDADSPKRPLGAPAAYWLDLRGYRPAEAAKAITRPILIIQGGRDYQVTKEDFDGWKQALEGRASVTLKLYPNLNHLFVAGEGKSTPAEYEKPGHVDAQVMDDIAAWVRQH